MRKDCLSIRNLSSLEKNTPQNRRRTMSILTASEDYKRRIINKYDYLIDSKLKTQNIDSQYLDVILSFTCAHITGDYANLGKKKE